MNPEKNYNEIDMECNYIDEDDDLVIVDNKNQSSCFTFKEDENSSMLDQPQGAVNTGIILNFNDDDEVVEKIDNNKEVFELEDFDSFKEKELVLENDLVENKKEQGEVENNYWKNLQKKHKESNKKGSYNTHFHFAGDPTKEMELFNKDMHSDVKNNLPDLDNLIMGNSNAGDITGTVSAGEGSSSSAGAEGGMGESFNKYNKLCEDLLFITGFDLIKNDDGTFVLKDNCKSTEDQLCMSNQEIFDFLNPYIEDCFIIPLQCQTGEKFKNCADWCNWYTPEIEKKFPSCKDDIKYCDLVANHINDCKF